VEAGIEADFPVSVVPAPAGAGTEPRSHRMLIWMGILKRRNAKAAKARAAAAGSFTPPAPLPMTR
jgi:hypothetical protein